jgi:hypothetical protein
MSANRWRTRRCPKTLDIDTCQGGTAMSTEASAPPVTRLDLKAPLTGVLVPIEQVPDPVFAQKMVGEGVSIDP